MSSEAVVSVRGISKRFEMYETPRHRLLQFLAGSRRQYFRELWALRDVSFDVAPGESVGLIGQNGSGKSTLLQIVTGTLAPTEGTIGIRGRVAALLELGAGFNTEFTGRENVYLNADILGVPREVMAERLERVVEFSELGDFIDQPVKTYSSGMYARLAFSAAIHVDPDVLIVDETLAVGDARFVAKCMRRIQELKSEGTSILFVSHDVTSVRALCERAIWLNDGGVVVDGDVFPVTGRYMEYMFRDEVAADTAPRAGRPEPSPVPTSEEAGERAASPAAQVPVALQEAIEAPAPVSAPADQEAAVAAPVTHWGSHKGAIRSVLLQDSQGTVRDVIAWGEPVEVVVRVHVPEEIPRQGLSVDFSIKDLRGSDLMVATTQDLLPIQLPDAREIQVRFRFRNCLTPGKYLLVVALEKRQGRDIYYYEYIEGARYFASTADWMMFGIFRPEVEQYVEAIAELESPV